MAGWTCIPMAKRRTLAKLQCIVSCVGDDDPAIKRDVKVNAVQLVNDVFENVTKRVSNFAW